MKRPDAVGAPGWATGNGKGLSDMTPSLWGSVALYFNVLGSNASLSDCLISRPAGRFYVGNPK